MTLLPKKKKKSLIFRKWYEGELLTVHVTVYLSRVIERESEST